MMAIEGGGGRISVARIFTFETYIRRKEILDGVVSLQVKQRVLRAPAPGARGT